MPADDREGERPPNNPVWPLETPVDPRFPEHGGQGRYGTFVADPTSPSGREAVRKRLYEAVVVQLIGHGKWVERAKGAVDAIVSHPEDIGALWSAEQWTTAVRAALSAGTLQCCLCPVDQCGVEAVVGPCGVSWDPSDPSSVQAFLDKAVEARTLRRRDPVGLHPGWNDFPTYWLSLTEED